MNDSVTTIVQVNEDLALTDLFLTCTICEALIGTDTRRNRKRLEDHVRRHLREAKALLASLKGLRAGGYL